MVKITALTELTTVDDSDIIAIVDDPTGNPISKKITRTNLILSKANTFTAVNTFNANTIFDTTTFNGLITMAADIDLAANSLLNTNYIDFDQISAPANPSANHGRMYVKQIDANNDGVFIKIKKAGGFVEVQIA